MKNKEIEEKRRVRMGLNKVITTIIITVNNNKKKKK